MTLVELVTCKRRVAEVGGVKESEVIDRVVD